MSALCRFRKWIVVFFVVVLATPTTTLAQRRFGRSCRSSYIGGRIGGRFHRGFSRAGFGFGRRSFRSPRFFRGYRGYGGFRSYGGYRNYGGYCSPYRFGYGFRNYGLNGYVNKYSSCNVGYVSPIILGGGLFYSPYYDNYRPIYGSLDSASYQRLDHDEVITMVPVDQERDENALQAQALKEFGRRQDERTNAPADRANVITQTSAERDRQVGISLGRGDKAFEEGDYDDAREEYVRALVKAGDDARVRIALGLSEYALGAYTDASAAVRRGISISPGLAQSSFSMKKIYGQTEDFTAHRQALEIFVRENPEEIQAFFLLGFVQYFSDQRDKALTTFDTYLSQPRHDPDVRRFIEIARESSKPGQMYLVR